MQAAFARRPPTGRPWPRPREWRSPGLPAPRVEPANDLTDGGGIDLGTAVRVSLSGGWAKAGMTEEGVVIEVVRPGCGPRAARVVPPRSTRSSVCRYVVQCWDRRVLRRAAEMVVVSP